MLRASKAWHRRKRARVGCGMMVWIRMATSCLSTRKRRAVSGGGEHGGRVLKSVNERLEQQNDEQMNQNVGSGGTFVETWWPFETDQALQTFEAEFDAPSQAVEVEDICRRGGVWWR